MIEAGNVREANHRVQDPRWELVERVAASRHLRSSPRMRDFLFYVCEKALAGQPGDIREQQIGTLVYRRRPDYNPSEDNIVRVEARRLRNALASYFEEEGRDEPVILRIPKGTYVPAFEGRPAIPSEPLVRFQNGGSAATLEPRNVPETSAAATRIGSTQRRTIRLVLPLTLLLALICAGLWVENRSLRRSIETPSVPAASRGIWSRLFDGTHVTNIVLADEAFALLQRSTETRLSLHQYIRRNYGDDFLKTNQDLIFSNLQYTSTSDIPILIEMLDQNPAYRARTFIRHAKALTTASFRSDHHILLGRGWANPWSALFEEQRNFVCDFDFRVHKSYYRNRRPLQGEHQTYNNDAAAGQVYGVVALLPNLTHTGNVLIVEGSTPGGTEAAWSFLKDEERFGAFMTKLGWGKQPAVPGYFEVLIRTRGVGRTPVRPEYIAHRIVPEG